MSAISIHDAAFRRNLHSILGCGAYVLNENTQTVSNLHGAYLGRFDDFTNRGLMQGNMSGNSGTSSSAPEIKF